MKCQPTHTSDWLTHRIQESVLFTASVYYRRYNLGTAREKRTIGKGMVEGGGSTPSYQNFVVFTNPKTPQICLCVVSL